MILKVFLIKECLIDWHIYLTGNAKLNICSIFGKSNMNYLTILLLSFLALTSDLAKSFTSDFANILNCDLTKMFTSDLTNIFTSDLGSMFTSDLFTMFTSVSISLFTGELVDMFNSNSANIH